MVADFCSLDELTATKKTLDNLKRDYPELFKKFLHMVHLTRAFQFKYQYFGCLFMDEDANAFSPRLVPQSILNLYYAELEKLKKDPKVNVLTQIFSDFGSNGYSRICLLLLGSSLESLVGPSIIK
jgi:hypothetical protein